MSDEGCLSCGLNIGVFLFFSFFVLFVQRLIDGDPGGGEGVGGGKGGEVLSRIKVFMARYRGMSTTRGVYRERTAMKFHHWREREGKREGWQSHTRVAICGKLCN